MSAASVTLLRRLRVPGEKNQSKWKWTSVSWCPSPVLPPTYTGKVPARVSCTTPPLQEGLCSLLRRHFSGSGLCQGHGYSQERPGAGAGSCHLSADTCGTWLVARPAQSQPVSCSRPKARSICPPSADRLPTTDGDGGGDWGLPYLRPQRSLVPGFGLSET